MILKEGKMKKILLGLVTVITVNFTLIATAQTGDTNLGFYGKDISSILEYDNFAETNDIQEAVVVQLKEIGYNVDEPSRAFILDRTRANSSGYDGTQLPEELGVKTFSSKPDLIASIKSGDITYAIFDELTAAELSDLQSVPGILLFSTPLIDSGSIEKRPIGVCYCIKGPIPGPKTFELLIPLYDTAQSFNNRQ
jgi:hypothetical protein